MSARPPVCLECGAPLAASSPAQLCTACLWNDGGEAANGMLKVPGHDVLEELARGGMGVVYRARERETRRTVALKMLRPRLADEEGMRQRFRLEASSVAALDHPGILPVYRVDETDDMPFFTMKLAAGGTLAERRADFRGKWREIAALMIRLAEAVQYAHQHGVLHRDLKPANVLFDEEGRAYLSDFGLVKLIDGVSDLTGSQSFLGTPHYSSPEVASSNAGAATVASDVWSLGAMLYELLTGRLPFDAPGLAPLLRKIAEEPPAPFTPANAVPADLRVITLKCLQKDPAQRYESAAALGADLKAWLEGRPITARAASLPEQFVAWTKRNPVLATLAAALVVSLALVGVLLWRGYAASQRSIAEARAGESAARKAEAASLLEETRARLREGQWVGRWQEGKWENRSEAVAAALRSHELHPSGAARDVLVSLLALPDLEFIGAVPYSGGSAVSFSGDFSRYLTRTVNGTEVRDATTHQVLVTIPEAASASIQPGPLSADGHRVCLSTSKGASVWEGGTKLAALPTGRWTPGFSLDGTITARGRRILNLTTQPPAAITLNDAEYDALAISPDGKLVVTAQRDRFFMQLVDSATGTVLLEYQLPGKGTMLRAVWSADSTHFCTGTTDGRMMRWNVETASPDWIVPAHNDGIDDLALFDDDRHLITVSRDGLAKIWNLHSQTSVATFPWSGRRVQASTDGRRLALDYAPDKKTLLFQFNPPPACTQVRLPASFVPFSDYQGRGAVVPADDGQSFAVTAGADVHILSRDGALLRSFPCGQCADLVRDPSGSGFVRSRRLVSNSHELMRVPLDWSGSFGDAALSLGKWNIAPALAPHTASGRLFASVRGGIQILDTATSAQTPHAPSTLPPPGRITALAFSPCGRYFAWAGVEDPADPARRIHLMDAAGEKEIRILPLREAPRILAFLPDGDSIIAGNNHGFHCLDTTTGRERWTVRHHRPQEPTLKTPICLSIAEKSGTIAAPLAAASVSLIDPATGRIRLTLRHPMGQTIRAVGISPDGTRVVAVGSYMAQFWNLEAVAAELARHRMTF